MIEKLLNKYRNRCGRCKRIVAIVVAATILAVTLRLRDHWGEYVSEVMWKFGSVFAVVLGWANVNSAAIASITAVVGLLANIYFQWRATNDRENTKND